MSTLPLTARLVFPVAGPPIPGGVVAVEGERIAFVGPAGSMSPTLDLGNVAILPGLVNAHTHLDLSGMRGLAPPSPDFTGWLRQVIAHRRQRTPEQVAADVRAGLAEAVRTGTTLLGDISGDGTSRTILADASIRSVVYRELIGLPQDRLFQAKTVLRAWRDEGPNVPHCRSGISPHAPYSVHTSMIDFTYKTQLPFCIHLGETAEELELLERHRGPFVSFLRELGVWESAALAPSIKSILVRTRRANHPLYVHCNYLSAEAPFLSAGSVVYCPRTHAAFGHPPHPFRDFLAHGVRVALGTDSLGSNPDLDLLADARFVHSRYPDFPGAQLLRMATLSGAEALGWEGETGNLEVGKSADLVVVPLPEGEGEAHELLFANNAPVSRVMCRGQWLAR